MLISTIDLATSTTETKSFLWEGSLSQQVNKHAGSHDPAFLCLEFGGAKQKSYGAKQILRSLLSRLRVMVSGKPRAKQKSVHPSSCQYMP